MPGESTRPAVVVYDVDRRNSTACTFVTGGWVVRVASTSGG
jgi:hypothetical protein